MSSATADLVGRTEECALLDRLLDQVLGGQSCVLEISGPSGIGKTALLDWLQLEVLDRNLPCFRSTGFAAEQDQPYGVLLDLMDQVGVGLDAEPMARSAELAVCRQVRQALAESAEGSAAMVLIVDDVHWADEASDGVLGYLARHESSVPTLIVLCARKLDGALQATGLDHLTEPTAQRLALNPLDQLDAAHLLADVPEQRRALAIEASGGNPFFAVQLAHHHAAGEGAGPSLGTESAADVPPAVLRSIAVELAALSGDARTLAQAAAVLGDPFAFDQAVAVASLPSEQISTAIDTLVDSALVASSGDLARCRFRHPILARATYRSIPTGTLRSLHERAAQVLRNLGSDESTIARHLESSASVGDRDAIACIAGAAQESRSLAPGTSARFFSSAIRLLPTGRADLAERMKYMDGQADCLIRTGEFEQAHEVLLTALDQVEADDLFGQAWLTVNCVRVEEWLGLTQTATDRLMRTWRRLADRPGPERAMIEGLLMIRASERGDVEQMRDFGERVVSTMSAVPHPYVDFTLSSGRAICEARIGSVVRAGEFIERAALLAEQLPEQELAAAVEPLLFLSSAELWLGRAEAGLGHALAGQQFAKRNNNTLAEVQIGMVCESGMTALGRLADAARIIDDCEQQARQLRQFDSVCYLLGRKSAVAALRGDWVESAAAAEACEVHLERVSDSTHSALSAFSIVRNLVASERARESVELVKHHAEGAGLPAVPGPLRPMVYEALVEAELALGRTGAAEDWALRATEAAARWETPSASCWAARSRSLVRLDQGLVRLAVDEATLAVLAATEATTPMELAFSRFLLGRAFASAADPSAALPELRAAQVTFESAGADGPLRRVEKSLRELGVATVPRQLGPRPAVGTLSRREQEVADLVSEGLTNPAIAKRLFVSARTVESHVSRIFAKLGVRSRADVGRLVRQARLAEQLDDAGI